MQCFRSDVGTIEAAARAPIGAMPTSGGKSTPSSMTSRAQSPDGYLNCWYNGREPEKRWTNLRDNHDPYNAASLEGVAYFRATDDALLGIMEPASIISPQPLAAVRTEARPPGHQDRTRAGQVTG
jgi:hypothetical protein